MQPRAKNVGIAGIEVHFPQLYVSQADLEKHHQVSSGKYTIGLGQTNMSFVESYEDINSISLTVVQNLLEKYNIDPRNIGRLEVGTETLLDKSKSTKTVLMELFSKYGNNDIEGVTSLNACYGGTNALFNTVSWMQSESWDGRLGIVVAADIAVYAKGPARPTGGAGAIAILIGPDAPIVFENVRSTYITHAYDFYKPDASSEYPTVDGQLSVKCYHEAIEKCYLLLKEKYQMQGREHLNLDSADYFCFHSPFGKMVYRSFITLLNIDIKEGRLQAKAFDEKIQSIAQKLKESDINPENKAYNELVKSFWNKKTAPATYLSSELGNIYTGSLYAGLISLIADEKIQLENKKIMMFSYGSGLASSMFSFRVVADLKGIRRRLNITERLQKRTKVTAEVYEEIMDDRRNFFNKPNWTPKINLENLAEGTFYLKNVDDKYRRNYGRKAKTTSSSLLSRNEVKNEEVDEKMLMKDQNPPEGAAVTRLKTVEKHLSTVTEKNLSASEESEENKKVVNDALVWTGFYKKTFKERLDHIKKIDPNVNVEILKSGGLSVNVADLMVENCIGVLSLPLGLSPNFLINDKFYTVPMCIEEPSVIAAASSAAKFIADKGKGFKTHSTASVMRGQIQVLDVNTEIASVLIDSNKKSLITNANLACASMVHRGGGVKDITTKILQSKSENSSSVIGPMLIVEFQIDVCEAMGANIINTVAEALSPYIIELVGGRVGLKILSNLCPERRAISYFEIPVKEMAWKSSTGKEVATKMLEAFTFAKLDVFRAVTHNKGILNGIDAVAIATGQDWRAIESAAHAYSFYKYGTYHPLTQYSIVTKNNEEFFTGQLEIPVAIGSKGGVLESNPIYKNNFRLLGFPSARTLAEVFVSVGLAQNFAALRAMAIEGIQKGHMNLHARNIALSAGIPQGLVSDAAEFMKSRGKISKDSANAYLEAIELFSELRFPKNSQNEARNMKQLSTFYIDIPIENLEEPLVFNLALDCTTDKPVHLSMQKEHLTRGGNDNPQMIELWNVIFGNKGYEWFISFISELEPISLTSVQSAKTSGLIRAIELSYKLKITGILINLVTFNMANLNQEKTRQVLEATRDWVQSDKKQDISLLLKGETLALRYGLSLLSELIKIFYFNIDQMLLPEEVKKALIDELFTIISSAFSTYLIWEQANSIKSFDFKEFLNQRRKRMSATLILLCDCLLLKTVEITPQAIQEIKHLGEIYEIEGTMARDLARWSFSKPVENNLFTYWLMMKGKFMGGDQIEVQQEFIKEISAIIGEKKKYLFDKFGDRTRKSYEVTKELIANHYLRKATKPKL